MKKARKPKGTLSVGLVQARTVADRDENLAIVADRIGEAARNGADIVCLQELFTTPYFARVKDSRYRQLAEPIPGPSSRALQAAAAESRVTVVGGSIYERARGGKLYNTTLVFGPDGRRLGKYRKVHIPQDPYYYEQDYFAPGNLGYVQVDTPKARIAPLICYDQWFPEAARANVLRGAEVLFYPTAIGWFPELKRDEPFSAQRWEDAMRAHASMNGVYAVAVNRVGVEGNIRFWGGSFVADPFGQVVARASRSQEELLVVEIDLSRIRESQQGWGFLSNRRPETYRPLAR